MRRVHSMPDPTKNDSIKFMPPEEVERMFAPLGKMSLDIAGIRRKFLNCPYGEHQKQALDIYLPNDGDGPFPIVFFAHGGAWQRGYKEDAQVLPFMGGLSRGYAVVSLGYRLVPEVRYPDNMFDIKAALRWIAKNADTYLLDSSRAALCGASAGAHLIMMAAFTQGQVVFGDMPDEPTCRILAIVEQFGPTDFSKFHAQFDESGYPRIAVPGAPSTVDALIGARADDIRNFLRFFNPIDNVHPGVPPMLLLHGRRDPMIPYQQAVELFKKINAVAGEGKAELEINEDFLHADMGYAAPEHVDRIYRFIDKYLR